MEILNNDHEFDYILENYKEICYNVNNAKEKYGSGDVSIMAVTKTVPYEKINFAIQNGVTLLGENRVQEYLSKKDQYDKAAEVQFIGHLQTNKVKYIADSVSMIQSVDSLKLASEINKQSAKHNRIMDILIEINIGSEITKSGIDQSALSELVKEISALENIKIRGLMAIPPIGAGEDVFERMHELFDEVRETAPKNVSMDILSMGMSGDYEVAIKHGSNLVRIGTKLFGARNYLKG
ncbi:MAG: YggS family pyridoxal phosphate-dependent enzyme [Ruminococcus sp.]|nr:YggS family pyridoxal phosphate-dependent enzyme [Ruminococcus sp.]